MGDLNRAHEAANHKDLGLMLFIVVVTFQACVFNLDSFFNFHKSEDPCLQTQKVVRSILKTTALAP